MIIIFLGTSEMRDENTFIPKNQSMSLKCAGLLKNLKLLNDQTGIKSVTPSHITIETLVMRNQS